MEKMNKGPHGPFYFGGKMKDKIIITIEILIIIILILLPIALLYFEIRWLGFKEFYARLNRLGRWMY